MRILQILSSVAALMSAMSLSATITWLSTTHDFGAFSEDMGPVSTVFRFVNESDEPVSVLAARASCGCTSPKYPKEAILPGDTAQIIVTYDPAGRPGRFSKYIAVDVSDGNGRTKLYVKGTVIGGSGSINSRYPIDAGSGLRLQSAVLPFGQVNMGHTRSATLTIYNTNPDSIRPTVEKMPRNISVIMEPTTLGPGEQGAAIFYYNTRGNDIYGFESDTIHIAANPGGTSFPLPYIVNIVEDFSKLSPSELKKAPIAAVSDKSIDFGKIEKNNGIASRTFTIRNNGKSQLIIRRIYSLDEGIAFSVDKTKLKPGKTATVTATVDTDKLNGALLNARGALITNDPADPNITIRLVGTF